MRILKLSAQSGVGSAFVCALGLAALAPAAAAASPGDGGHAPPPRTILVAGGFLARVRQRGDAAVLREVRIEADKAMKQSPLSVMDKHATPPSGDKHDYMSLAPYFWPNPATANHLPYVRRDGQHNPQASSIEDHANLFRMEDAVHALALGYFFTGDVVYAKRASLLLHVWFLDPATRMNPGLKYAQAVLGVNEGRGTGILDARGLADVVDALALLAGSGSWTATDDAAMHTWFDAYFNWLTTSSNGRNEAAAKNNHGSWYDEQAEAIALYLGKTQFARELAETAKTKRIALQIQADGQQPLEEVRTKSFGYCVFNLQALMRLASMAQTVGVDMWSYRAEDGASIRLALDYLLPFADKQEKWSHEDIEGMSPDSLQAPLLMAALHYRDAAYEAAAIKMKGKDDAKILLLEREFAESQATAANTR